MGRVQRPGPRAGRGRAPAASRARQVRCNLLPEPGRVLHGARGRAARAGRGGRAGPVGRRARRRPGARRDPRARRGADRTPGPALEARPRPGTRRGGNRRRDDRRLLRARAGEARQVLRARGLPDPHPARRRPRPDVPVRLGALAVARRDRVGSRDRRRAVRPGQGARGPRPVRPRRQAAGAAGVGHRVLPAHAVPGNGDCGARALPRHARRRLRAVGRRRRPARGRRVRAAPAALRRRRPARGLALGVPRHARTSDRRTRRALRGRSTRSRGCSTSPSCGSSSRSTAPT